MPGHDTEQAAYDLARETYAAEEARFDDAESKINRYLSVLFVVLGASVISVDRLRSLPSTPGNALFRACMVSFFVMGLVAFVYFLRALRVQDLRTLKLGREVVEYFAQFPLPDALRGLAVNFFEAADEVRARAQEKIGLAARGYDALVIAVGFAVLSSLSYYFVVELPQEPAMAEEQDNRGSARGGESNSGGSQPAAGGEGGGSGAQPPSSSPSSSTAAEQAAANLFTTVKKSFEGGTTREGGG